MIFGTWDSQIHDNVDQIKRICAAKKISSSKVNIDKGNETAVISGSASNPYNVSLSSCDCSDFSIRGLPCKHIYRLALDLGYLSDLPEYDKSLGKTFDISAEIERYHELYLKGVLSADNYVKLAETLGKIKL